MKYYLIAVCFLIPFIGFSQGEARNWYFGRNAGIQFLDDDSVQPLAGAAIFTNEGCSTISDSGGNLLFYTDGRNVWDKNHVLMPNGNYDAATGLFGDPSSTQSGIIVPKKGNPNIYYIFTVDEPHHQNAQAYPNQFTGTYVEQAGPGFVPADDDGFNNGLNYSVVDLSLTGSNGSIGDVTERNIPLSTYDAGVTEQLKYKCSEKITAVKSADGTGFWVLSHFIDRFYAFYVDATGVNETPVISTLAPVIPTGGYRRNSIGYLKASPDGNKIAVAHNQIGTQPGEAIMNGVVYLYDFDDATGQLSNPVELSSGDVPYGIEFSQETKKLYVTYSGSLEQFNLLATDIPASRTFISFENTGALQLGPNGKIYKAINGSTSLGVINAPEEDGVLCNYVPSSQPIGGPASRMATLGLPPFITSLLSATVQVSNNCIGEPSHFELNVNIPFDSVAWDFGDATPVSSDNSPQHTYQNTGTYTVTVTITKEDEVTVVTKDIVVSEVPVANAAVALTECDPENDAVEVFNLTANDANVLGTQSNTEYEVKYFTTQENADANTNPVNAAAFSNTSNPQTVYVRVQNKANRQCYDTTSFEINALNTAVLNATAFELCDDDSDGDDTNGQVTFTLTDVTDALVQSSGFTTTYYPTQAEAEEGTTPPLANNFYNTLPNQQTLYARLVNNTFTNCFTVKAIQLIVNPLPNAVTGVFLTQCDIGVTPDGLTQYNLHQADTQFTGGDSLYETAYYPTVTDAQNDINEITGGYTNTSDPQTIGIRLINTYTGCYRILQLTLQASMNLTTPILLEACDDDGTEDDLYSFNLTDAGIEDNVNTVAYYLSELDALLEQNPVPAAFTTTLPNQQNIYARIENNNECVAIQQVKLIVHPLPDIETDATARVCLNTLDFIRLDAGIMGSAQGLSYLWSNGATTPTIMVNEAGTYTVTVKTIFGCEKIRTIVVTPSDVAIFEDIEVKDLRDINTVTVNVSPGQNVNTIYLYSLDDPNGPWQESNFFDDVEAGIHTVYVYDTNGCGIVAREISVLEIPKFFTPNEDGINDYWRIVGVNSDLYSTSEIFVFDRYGKLITGLSPEGMGWDGMLNGYKLPATDYWYVVKLDDGRTVRGHFSLIR